MKKLLFIILFLSVEILFAGPQYTDIKNSIITVDFSRLGYKTIITNGKTNEWKGKLPVNPNTERYTNNEYIWYDAMNDDVGDGDYAYPYNNEFGRNAVDIKQFRVCHDNAYIYLFLQTYYTNSSGAGTTNKIFRSAALIGIDTGTPNVGSYDFIEGNGNNSDTGSASELRSTKIRGDYFIFSELNKYWYNWHSEKSYVCNEMVQEGKYSFKAIMGGYAGSHGGTIIFFPESKSVVDMSKATNLNIWVYDTQGNNTIELGLRDSRGRLEKRYSDWDTAVNNRAIQDTWTRLIIPLTNFNFVNLTNIAEIQIYEYNDGIYYFDDLRYGTNSFHTFDLASNMCHMWDANGTMNRISCQPYGVSQWGIKIPKSVIGDPAGKQWQFIVGTGFHENHMFREIQPPNGGVPLEWYGIGGDASWYDNTSPDPDVYDLIGASLENQIADLSDYKNIFTTFQSNLESLNVTFSPNPYNPQQGKCLIYFSVPVDAYVKVKILSLDGNLVKQLLDKNISALISKNVYELEWDGKDNSDNYVKSGVYIILVQYKTPDQSRQVKKFIKVYR